MSSAVTNFGNEIAKEVIRKCGMRYGFDVEEALREVSVSMMEKKEKKEKKSEVKKSLFPLPFSGEKSEMCCQALRQNNGLYTQCQSLKKNAAEYCKSCEMLAQKSETGIPEYGTIEMRLACGLMEYIDPKGRKPTPYTKVMKKYNVTEEQVNEEAGKFGMQIAGVHFVAPEETKRGRPAKEPKEAKEAKGSKGRPKKTNKVVQLVDEGDDLFASLVASSLPNEIAVESPSPAVSEISTDQEQKAEKKALAQQEKAEKKALEKAEKKALAQQQKAEKKALAQQEKAEKKAQKKAQVPSPVTESLVPTLNESLAPTLNESLALSCAEPFPKVEEETYKKCTGANGKKYIRSQQTGIVYDFEVYTNTEELVAVGKWDADSKSIVFQEDSDSEDEEE
jgi:hypothetical protein